MNMPITTPTFESSEPAADDLDRQVREAYAQVEAERHIAAELEGEDESAPDVEDDSGWSEDRRDERDLDRDVREALAGYHEIEHLDREFENAEEVLQQRAYATRQRITDTVAQTLPEMSLIGEALSTGNGHLIPPEKIAMFLECRGIAQRYAAACDALDLFKLKHCVPEAVIGRMNEATAKALAEGRSLTLEEAHRIAMQSPVKEPQPARDSNPWGFSEPRWKQRESDDEDEAPAVKHGRELDRQNRDSLNAARNRAR